VRGVEGGSHPVFLLRDRLRRIELVCAALDGDLELRAHHLGALIGIVLVGALLSDGIGTELEVPGFVR